MTVTLTIDGNNYTRWISVRVSRGLKKAESDFQFTTPAELVPPILPFAACTISEGGETILTGYVVAVEPTVGPRESLTIIKGGSKTMDLVDTMPELATNQFKNSKLDQIARALAGPLGIGVQVQAPVGDAFPDATFERSETAFAFLERLARQRGVLLTDDANGNLVLATVGTGSAPASLVMGKGGNVTHAAGILNGKDRFSKYTVRAQAGKQATEAGVEADNKGIAQDGGVPRYRPWSGIGESALTKADAQLRAQWEASTRSGKAVQARLSVPEWRANGKLWQVNTLAQVNIPRLALNDQYLIGEVDYHEDDQHGRRTELLVMPPSAFTPGQLKVKGSTPGNPWDGIIPVHTDVTGGFT